MNKHMNALGAQRCTQYEERWSNPASHQASYLGSQGISLHEFVTGRQAVTSGDLRGGVGGRCLSVQPRRPCGAVPTVGGCTRRG